MSGVAGRRRRFWCLPVRSVYDAPGSTIFVSLPSQPQARLGLPLSLSVSPVKPSQTCMTKKSERQINAGQISTCR